MLISDEACIMTAAMKFSSRSDGKEPNQLFAVTLCLE
jgi:hypothetical protein